MLFFERMAEKKPFYDGEFEYNGHMIKYHIGDEFKNKKYDNHGQLVKALRYIDFIDETDSKKVEFIRIMML